MKKTFLLSLLLIFLGSCNVTTNSDSSSALPSDALSESIQESSSLLESSSSQSESNEDISSSLSEESGEESTSPSEDSSIEIPESPSEDSSTEIPESPSESETPSDPSESEESDSSNSDSLEDLYEKYWTYEGTYYNSLDLSLTGDALKSALNVIVNNGARNTSYSGLRSAYKYTDVDPENEDNIILYYTGESREFLYGQSTAFQGSINREHVWPQSRYTSLGSKQSNTPYDDILNVRPADKNVNGGRGNGLFDYGLNEPNDNYKGDVARVLLYVATRYKTLSLVDNTSGGDNSMGKLSTLLEWNLKYPVSDVELRRNNGAQKVQNNRNPYIDNPGFACAIWGATNDKTKSVCSGSYVPENPPVDVPSDSSGSIEDIPELDQTWALVKNTSDLHDGDTIVIANNSKGAVAGALSSSSNPYLSSLEATFSADKLFITSMDPSALMFEVNQASSGWTLSYNGKLLGATATKKMSLGSGNTTWTISISNGVATISNSTGTLQYNSDHPRFTTYTSSLNSINIYKLIG